MPALDRLAPLAASATMLVCIPTASAYASSPTMRVPITQAHSLRVVERDTAVNRYVLRVRAAVQATQEPFDVFTAADMAVLEAAGRFAVDDDFDYGDPFDYDDD